MILSRTGQLIYKQGLVLISMSQGLKLLSIMKSKPNTSKLFAFLSGSIKQKDAFTASVAICLSFG
jgi:hypothetical protein